MAYNNTVTLTGNLGSEVRIIEEEGKTPFAAVSLATSDSYKDEQGNWVQMDSVWHSLIAFSPAVIAKLQSLKTGTRITAEGKLSYRPFETVLEDGRTVTKNEAAIIVFHIELVPLVKTKS